MKRLALLLACIAVASCSDSTPPPTATTIVLSATSVNLNALNATQVLTATVEDQHGNAMPSATVSWTSSAGSAVITVGSPTSTATVTAATNGVSLVTASAGKAQTSVVVDVAQTPAAINKVAGDAQSARATTQLPTAPQVKVVDRLGSPVSGQVVTFVVATGGGTVGQASVTTAADGTASTSWVLGGLVGTQSLTASDAIVGSTTFIATAVSAPSADGTVVATAGDNQAAMASTAIPVAPAVRVRDISGNAVVGTTVTFAVASGGGTITGATATTNSNGIATLGSWTLGSTAGPNSLTATSANGSATLTAVGCTGGGGTGYAITLCFTTDMTTNQRNAFQLAATRWGTIITGDLPDFPNGIQAGSCGTNAAGVLSPSFNFTIDDLVIFATIDAIDGVNGILGQASPCLVRSSDNLTLLGTMEFDIADVGALETSGQLNSVILHEMGHVLGIGTLWTTFGLLHNAVTASTPAVGPSPDTYFSGPNAIAGFNTIGGSTYTKGQKVPVEDSVAFGAGTYNSHWRESVLANELMTGFLNAGANPLSVLTIQSLADLGYAVNTAAADPFFLTLSADRSPGTGTVPTQPIDLRNDGRPFPIYSVDVFGRMIRIR